MYNCKQYAIVASCLTTTAKHTLNRGRANTLLHSRIKCCSICSYHSSESYESSFKNIWGLTALRLGDDRAAALGVKVRALRLRGFVFVSVATGVAVAFVGTIGFVGLVAPHVARMLLGEDQRVLLPGAALAGALLLSLASVASKTVSPGALFPIGIVTALVGVPFFVWLILASRRSHW